MGDNDQRSTHFCSNVQCALCKFHITKLMVKTHVIKLLGIEGPNTCDQIACHAFHSLLVEVQMNSGYIHAMHAR